MSIFGISLFGSKHVRVETRDRHLEWSIKGCCVKTCLWLIANATIGSLDCLRPFKSFVTGQSYYCDIGFTALG